MAKDRIYVRIRKDDTIIKEHFSQVKESDFSYEARRLLEKAILIERKEKELLEGISFHNKQDS